MYQLLLWLFPRDVREDFGAAMEALFLEHRRHVHGFGIVRLWIAAIGDALRHGIGARLDRTPAFARALAPAGSSWTSSATISATRFESS